ncbi:MAG: sterol desaturase family protein [Rhizobiaceae bacterium]
MNFEELVSSQEGIIRLGVFVGLFALFALTEYFTPRRKLTMLKSHRWFTNIAIIILDGALVRVIFPAAAVGVALWANANGWGLFNLIEVPFWLAALISIVVLDFAVWWSHLLSHKIPLLWRIHRMHHSDRDIDVSTAIRFHPIEIIVSMAWKVCWVIALGAPAVAVILFEILLNGLALFNHSNTKLPLWLDAIVRKLIVTPDMHRVHHSIIVSETDSNYGFNLSIWDRMFSTYTAQPKLGHDDMIIGIEEWQDEGPTKLGWTLSVPFISQKK